MDRTLATSGIQVRDPSASEGANISTQQGSPPHPQSVCSPQADDQPAYPAAAARHMQHNVSGASRAAASGSATHWAAALHVHHVMALVTCVQIIHDLTNVLTCK